MQNNAVSKSDGFALSAISNATKWVKVFRYSFSETIRTDLSIAFKVILSLSDRDKIFTSDWLLIDVCENAVYGLHLTKCGMVCEKLYRNTLKYNFNRQNPAYFPGIYLWIIHK